MLSRYNLPAPAISGLVVALAVPLGAFFIDFTNALIITGFINFWH